MLVGSPIATSWRISPHNDSTASRKRCFWAVGMIATTCWGKVYKWNRINKMHISQQCKEFVQSHNHWFWCQMILCGKFNQIMCQILPKKKLPKATGMVASWLVCSTPDQAVLVWSLSGHCVAFLGKALYSLSASLHPSIQMGTSGNCI